MIWNISYEIDNSLMRVLVISDIHGNLPALEKLFYTEKGNYDQVISLGDVINYAPWSNECVEFLVALNNTVMLMGNHETFFINRKCESTSKVCNAAFDYIFPGFKYFDIISNYQNDYCLAGHTFIHTIDDSYIYPDSNITISQNYFIGHSHRQFKISQNGHCLYNVGSVGQNRVNINQINYAVYDVIKDEIELKTIEFGIEVLIQELEVKKFPKIVVDYYKSKR